MCAGDCLGFLICYFFYVPIFIYFIEVNILYIMIHVYSHPLPHDDDDEHSIYYDTCYSIYYTACNPSE